MMRQPAAVTLTVRRAGLFTPHPGHVFAEAATWCPHSLHLVSAMILPPSGAGRCAATNSEVSSNTPSTFYQPHVSRSTPTAPSIPSRSKTAVTGFSLYGVT